MTASPTQPRLVLLVDDDEDARFVLKELLEHEGYAVEGVSGAEAALTRLALAPRPALIILDLLMPGVGGVRFLEIRSADRALASIPVVVVTASGLSCLGQNVFAVLPKPLDVAALLASVDQICGRPAMEAPGLP